MSMFLGFADEDAELELNFVVAYARSSAANSLTLLIASSFSSLISSNSLLPLDVLLPAGELVRSFVFFSTRICIVDSGIRCEGTLAPSDCVEGVLASTLPGVSPPEGTEGSTKRISGSN